MSWVWVRPGRRWQKYVLSWQQRESAQGERRKGRTHQSLMCCGGRPSLSLSPRTSPVVPVVPVVPPRQARQGPSRFHLTSYTYTCTTTTTQDTQKRQDTTHTHGFPAAAGSTSRCMQDHASHAEHAPVPRLRTKLPGFGSPGANYRCPPPGCCTRTVCTWAGQTDLVIWLVLPP